MASQSPPSSNLPSSMGPGARPVQPGESPGSILKELQEIRASYSINLDSDALRLGYNFRGQNRKYDLPFVSMPIGDATRWLVYGGYRRARVTGLFTLDMIRGAENMAGRPLTQSEAEGFALHTSKRMRYNFLGTLVGFGVGYSLAIASWRTMKFPFFKAKPIESYDYFPARGLPLLKGAYSRLMWQITRANIYAAISLIFAQMVLGSIGDSVMSVGLYRDTRTQEVVKSMKGNFDRIRLNRVQQGQAPAVPQKQQGHDQDPQSEDFYGNEGKGLQDYYGKSGNYAGDQTFTDGSTDTGVLDDNTVKQRDMQRASQRPQYTQQSQRSSSSGRTSNPDFFFDDASPTAGNDPDMDTTSSYQQNRGSGSAWDRVRRGGRPPSRPATQSSPQEETVQSTETPSGWRRQSSQNYENKSDSFSFSGKDEERQLAKQQAQKEFDAMLERERREGGSEGYKYGSFAAESGSETPQQSEGSAWDRRRKG